jgi:arabinofuranosyltransferase
MKKIGLWKSQFLANQLWVPVLLGFGLYSSWSRRWVCDDAFISFRYANNLSKGLGPVFNEGEKVEGYTNFLWTYMLYIGSNFDPIPLSFALGTISYLVILVVLYRFTSYIQNFSNPSNGTCEALPIHNRFYFIPLAAIGYVLHKYTGIFATSGLETSFFTMLVLSGFYLLVSSNQNQLSVMLSFLLLSLASMTRPEGLLYFAVAWITNLFFISGHSNYHLSLLASRFSFSIPYFKKILTSTLPFCILYLPYFFWKYTYYGWIFPNTYYAKSGGEMFWEQGFIYVRMFFTAYPIFLSIPFLGFYSFYKVWKSNLRLTESQQIYFILCTAPLLHLLYIVKVGGDFMFARFLIPILPFLYLLLEVFLSALTQTAYIPLATILIGSLLFYNPYHKQPIPIVNGISNEQEIYKLSSVNYLQKKLIEWKEPVESSGAGFAFGGAQAIYSYYWENNYFLEVETGLTDTYLAHRKIETRGRVGHEKQAPLAYLYEKNIHIHLQPNDSVPKTEYNELKWKGLPSSSRILIYQRNVFERLKENKDFQFTDFRKYLQTYIQDIQTKDKEQIQKDYESFKKYYFDHNEDKEYQKYFE